MSDYVGLNTIPIPTTGVPVGDPLLQRVGDFIAAALTAGCGAAWDTIATGEPIVRTVQTNDPSDNTFSESTLPALFVYRGKMARKLELLCSDFARLQTQLVVLWIPHVAVQDWKARREPFFHAVESVVMNAFAIGRTPGWVLAGDTDVYASDEGSNLADAIGVQRPTFLTQLQFENVELVIEIEKQPDRHYPGLRMLLTIAEEATCGPSGDIYPAAMDTTLYNAAEEETGEETDLPT